MAEKKSKLYNISDNEFIEIVQNSSSLTNCISKCGLSIYGLYGRKIIKQRCEELKLDITHWDNRGSSFSTQPSKKRSNEEIFVENSDYKNIRRRVIKDKLIEYKCAICGNEGEYNGEPLTLHLDHINGIHNDNRLENLRFLCPNCHSQTETFGTRNIKGIYAEKYLINGEEKTAEEIGEEYNLNPALIKNFFNKYTKETVLAFLKARKENPDLKLDELGQSWLTVYKIEKQFIEKED